MVDSFDRGYIILHNQDNDYVSTSITKFKYSKHSLNHLIEKLKQKEEVPKAYIDEIEEFYREKDGVDTIPLSLTEIRDVLLDADLLIEFVKKKQIDWEIINIEEVMQIAPNMFKARVNSKEKVLLEHMSKNALTVEALKLEQETEQLIEKVKGLIEKAKGNDNK